jgi:hypothetical protein
LRRIREHRRQRSERSASTWAVGGVRAKTKWTLPWA